MPISAIFRFHANMPSPDETETIVTSVFAQPLGRVPQIQTSSPTPCSENARRMEAGLYYAMVVRWCSCTILYLSLQPSNWQALSNFLVCPENFRVQYVLLHPVLLTYTLTKKNYDMLRLCIGCKSANATREDISICRRDMLSMYGLLSGADLSVRGGVIHASFLILLSMAACKRLMQPLGDKLAFQSKLEPAC